MGDITVETARFKAIFKQYDDSAEALRKQGLTPATPQLPRKVSASSGCPSTSNDGRRLLDYSRRSESAVCLYQENPATLSDATEAIEHALQRNEAALSKADEAAAEARARTEREGHEKKLIAAGPDGRLTLAGRGFGATNGAGLGAEGALRLPFFRSDSKLPVYAWHDKQADASSISEAGMQLSFGYTSGKRSDTEHRSVETRGSSTVASQVSSNTPAQRHASLQLYGIWSVDNADRFRFGLHGGITAIQSALQGEAHVQRGDRISTTRFSDETIAMGAEAGVDVRFNLVRANAPFRPYLGFGASCHGVASVSHDRTLTGTDRDVDAETMLAVNKVVDRATAQPLSGCRVGANIGFDLGQLW